MMNDSTSNNCRRGRLCQRIAAFSEEADFEDVKKALDQYFQPADNDDRHGDTSTSKDSTDNNDNNISPLMLACDKGNIACLRFLEIKYNADPSFANLIGNPLEESKEDKNTPLHFAAVSGKKDVIDILTKMGANILDFGKIQNSHGDSPLMMASVNGNLPFLRCWIDLVKERTGDVSGGRIKLLLEAKNSADDTCITLACCHGHPELVEMLISVGGVGIDHNQTEKCRSSLKRMDQIFSKNPSLFDQHKEKLEGVKRSLKVIERELGRRTEEMATLLFEDTYNNYFCEESAVRLNTSNQKSKKKKKNRRKIHSRISKTTDHDSGHVSKKEEAGENNKNISTDGDLKLTQLANGAMAVNVFGTSDNYQNPDFFLGNPDIHPPPNADELFRQRFEGDSSDLEAVMDSLCLDVSMLLYTNHGMALNLSPSQLDAIDGILKKQSQAVQEAKEIQRRLHDTSSNNPTSNNSNK